MTAPPRLNRATIAALLGGRLDADAQAALGHMLDNALAAPHAAAAALGLEYTRAEKLARIAARDSVFPAAGNSLPPSMSDNGKAKLISSVFLRYHRYGWLRDCDLDQCPARLKGLERFAWQAFRLFDSNVGLAAETVRPKLGTSDVSDQPDDL